MLKEIKVKWLFMVDYYDCVLSAVVLDEDDNYLFAVREWNEESDNHTGRFLLYEIPIDKLIVILGRHELFKRYVGHNCDFLEDGGLASESNSPPRRNIGAVHQQEKWKKFYDIFAGLNEFEGIGPPNQSPVGYCGE